MKNSVVRARIDAELKAHASAVLASCGLEASDAIRLFLLKVVECGGLPFPIRNKSEVRIVAPARLSAMKRAAQARDHAIAARKDVSDGQMLLIRPDQVRGARVKWPSAGLCD